MLHCCYYKINSSHFELFAKHSSGWVSQKNVRGSLYLDYFSTLNYSLANEDSSVELSILPAETDNVVVVAGSGARVLPLFAKSPRRVVCIDVSPAQLNLTELRIAAARSLSLSDFRDFFGYGRTDIGWQRRRTLFYKLHLSRPAQEGLAAIFNRNGWQPIIYLGRWERAFRKLASIAAKVIGPKAMAIMKCQSLDEQRGYLKTHFPHWRWQLAIALIGQSYVFNRMLYGSQLPSLNLAKSDYRYFKERLAKTLDVCPARENFFLRILMQGRLPDLDGLPLECSPALFESIKLGIDSSEVEYVCSDLYDYLAQNPGRADFVSLSDTPSYAESRKSRVDPTPLAASSNLATHLATGLSQGGIAVARYFRHRPDSMKHQSLIDVTGHYIQEIERELTCIYGIDVFQKPA
jgi:S-adenosylmethionine-diacylglycerol 3-amino-3-carboxypropyl transferase